MKLFTNALALSAISGASAFSVQPNNAFSMGTSLNSDNIGYGTGQQVSTIPKPAVGNSAGASSITTPQNAEFTPTQEILETITPVTVQGDTLRTCSFDESVERVEVFLTTSGRPLNANVELWQGPDNAPQKMSVYLEDGCIRPFRATVECPGASNAIAIRNTGQMEFPLTAGVEADYNESNAPSPSDKLTATSTSRVVQGGAVYTAPFPPSVQSVQISLKSDGRPMTARVELLQGPNNNKQVMEIYTEEGGERPFYAIFDTPGVGNVVRIVNTATVEFPLSACIEPYIVDEAAVSERNRAERGMTWS